MTDKSDFDWWINRDRDTCNIASEDPIPGTASAIREQLWFRWSSPTELGDKLIEMVACYPNRSLASETEERRDAIWDRAASVLCEQVSIKHDDVPQLVRGALLNELKRAKKLEGHDASRRTLRWQHPAGFHCFLDQGELQWSTNRWQMEIDIEGLLQAPSGIECRVLQQIARECGNQALSDAIKASYSLAGEIDQEVPLQGGRDLAVTQHESAKMEPGIEQSPASQIYSLKWTPERHAKLLSEHLLLKSEGNKKPTQTLAVRYGCDSSHVRAHLKIARQQARIAAEPKKALARASAANKLGKF